PEIAKQQSYIEKIIKAEEENFGATLENGIKQFTAKTIEAVTIAAQSLFPNIGIRRFVPDGEGRGIIPVFDDHRKNLITWDYLKDVSVEANGRPVVLPADDAFLLYDTFGFPLDLTE